ncbi:MAG: hybrid sensor histidine kinase/response regulator, partial [Lysobacter sp.]
LWMLGDAYRSRLARRNAWKLAQRERELAEQASLAKTRFLATLGHEVRTPMTGVMGMSELLLGTPLDAQQRGYTESIRGAGEHLLRLMDDALDLARIESGKLQLTDEAFDLRQLIAELVALMAPLARQCGLDFHVDVASELPLGVRGDPSRVRQILMNLLGNAIKFTERGEVSLRVSAADAPCASINGIRFEISDTGPGINREQQARLFRRFEQAEGGRTAARYGGSGLGLAICQELTAAMHGTIEVDSMRGVGTRFSVRLPLPAAAIRSPLSSEVEAAPTGRQSLSLLLVEDDAIVAEVVGGLLRVDGHRVVHVSHALAALTEITTIAFDAALLDLDLPGLDGFALARQLRVLGVDLPLIAITARADAEAQPKAMAAGFDRFIRKPVTRAMLTQVLDEAIGAYAVKLGIAVCAEQRPITPAVVVESQT